MSTFAEKSAHTRRAEVVWTGTFHPPRVEGQPDRPLSVHLRVVVMRPASYRDEGPFDAVLCVERVAWHDSMTGDPSWVQAAPDEHAYACAAALLEQVRRRVEA